MFFYFPGRISKPPKHMVQEYKHIHLLDWDEDYDDSDGGYSDFKDGTSDDGEGSKSIWLDSDSQKSKALSMAKQERRHSWLHDGSLF